MVQNLRGPLDSWSIIRSKPLGGWGAIVRTGLRTLNFLALLKAMHVSYKSMVLNSLQDGYSVNYFRLGNLGVGPS